MPSWLWVVLTGRVEGVDIQRQVHGELGANSVPDPLDDAVGADGIDLAGFHDLEAAVAVVLVIARPAESGADTGVDVGVVAQQALLSGMVEVRSVVDAGHLGGRATEDLGAPLLGRQRRVRPTTSSRALRAGERAEPTGIQMAVKVDDRHGSVRAVDGPQQGEGDGVVATQSDHPREGLAVESGSLLQSIRLGLSGEDAEVAVLDLGQRVRVVVPWSS